MRNEVLRTVIVSACFLTAFWISIFVLGPIQNYFLGDLPNYLSLLFLPHGVRLLTAWLYREKSVLYVFPGALLSHMSSQGIGAITEASVLTTLIGSVVGIGGILAVEAVSGTKITSLKSMSQWKLLLIAGGIASLANSILNCLIYGTDVIQGIGYLIGDISGQFFLMVILVFVFRIERRMA
ncbi:hypothetical protein A9199_12015 [Donghicola sp. JL3646]|jgi:hypothetical protein|nr:hypothetical protein BSK21_13550 [Marivivens sp. JLT3646]OBR35127.1 hypothetical protein A9199_12015 [Donghicola sp. JL3646]